MMTMDALSNPLNRNADISDCCIHAPFARLGIRTEMVDGSLMLSRITYLPPLASLKAPKNDLAALVAKQCQAYFLDPTAVFDLPLKPQGSEYQQQVWQAVAKVASGERTSYGVIARELNTGARAVGNACGANPFPLIIPCHRVVAKASLGGFFQENKPGLFRDIKAWLLDHEARA
jgi:methylated-DNA-[protein]-cysteine S-methyltransferase